MDVSDLERLYQLQECEQRLLRLRRVRQTAPEVRLIGELEDRLEKLAKLRELLQRRLVAVEKRVQELEAVIESDEQSTKTLRGRLFSGEVTNARELTRLQTRMQEMETKAKGDLDALVAALEQLNSLQQQKAKVDANEAQTLSRFDAARARLEQRAGSWDLEEAMLLGEVEHLRSLIAPSSLSWYDHMKSRTDGTPIASVSHGACGGCRMSLPVAITALQGRSVARCEHCGRLLYWPG